MSMSIGFGGSADEKLQRAYRTYRDERGDAFLALSSAKLDMLQHFDVPGMGNAVAICCWGRSGSVLLASYLDGHDDIVMLPMLTGYAIYAFFHEYESLSVWEKLIAYPAFDSNPHLAWRQEHSLFDGVFPIAASHYYAAIHALFAVYGARPAAWLDARPTFFQLLHVACTLATGRRPRSPRPLMVYSLHNRDDKLARLFGEDFPSGRFIHTIRDPISVLDSTFDSFSRMETSHHPLPHSGYLKVALHTVSSLLTTDRPHWGMEARTRAVRFEDMHLAPEETMRRLASWLGIPYQPSLLDSTFNGVPWFVESGGATWTGPNPANVRRRSKNLNLADRLMIFAIFEANFVAWNYTSPRIFRSKWMRLSAIALLWFAPMKMEMVTARMVMQLQVLPCLRNGRVGFASRAILRLVACRWAMMRLVATETRVRQAGEKQLLTLL
jgi:hypothetical protein